MKNHAWYSKGFGIDFQRKINDQRRMYNKYLHDQRSGWSYFSAFLAHCNYLKTSLKVAVFDAILVNHCLLSSDYIL